MAMGVYSSSLGTGGAYAKKSLFQQQVSTQRQASTQQQKQDRHNFYKKNGKPPYTDSDLQADYEKLKPVKIKK